MPNFIIKKNVPILDEHVIRDEDGKELAKIDEARLHQIAARNNKRMQETGDWIPIVIGHTKGEPGDYVPEEQQPEIVGYAGNLRVSKFKKTARKAIHATFKFFKDKVDKVRRFPRRSIELWLGDWKIDPISLLGATTPERDLGLLQLQAGGKKLYRRILKDRLKFSKEGNVEHEAIVKAVLEALKQTDVWQFMEQLMDEANQGEGEGEPGLDEGDDFDGEVDDADLNPEDQGVEQEPGGQPQEVNDEQEEGREPVRYSQMGGCSGPTGTNTYTQGGFSGNGMKQSKKGPTPSKGGKQQYQRPGQAVRVQAPEPASDDVRQLRVQYARATKAVKGLQYAYNDLRLKFQRSEREKDLMALQSEGYEFDRDEELDWLSGLDDQEYANQLTRIRKRYQKAPVGPGFDLEAARSGNPNPGLNGRDRDQAMQIAQYAQRKGITYEEALQEMGD